MRVRFLQAGIVATSLILGVEAARAQDAAVVNAKTIKVKVDNDRVRVLEAELQPGDKEQMHSHPSSIIYVIAGGTIRNHAADGKTTEATLQTGAVIYRDPVTHWAENIGTAPIHMIVVELKQPR
jgi:quercetin dioxygenase-like cupin family protein